MVNGWTYLIAVICFLLQIFSFLIYYIHFLLKRKKPVMLIMLQILVFKAIFSFSLGSLRFWQFLRFFLFFNDFGNLENYWLGFPQLGFVWFFFFFFFFFEWLDWNVFREEDHSCKLPCSYLILPWVQTINMTSHCWY